MKITSRHLSVACLAACMLALSACGGGGSGSTATPNPAPNPAPSPAPGTVAATISKDNYLDAFALTSLAGIRLDAVNTIIAGAYAAVIASHDVPGTYPCPKGGTVSTTRVDGSTRSFSASNCNMGTVTINSGKLSAVGASATVVGGVYYLSGGQFTAEQLLFTVPDGLTGEQTLSGQFTLNRNADLSMTGSGTGSFTRNGRADVYKDIKIATGRPDSHHEVSIETLEFKLESPRFPVALNVVGKGEVATVSAADGAQLVVDTSASNGSIKLELRPSAGVTPTVSSTLAPNDPVVRDAFARVVK